MSRSALVLGLALVGSQPGCLDSGAVTCASGLQCASDEVCAPVDQACVSREQVEACAGQPEAAPCESGGLAGFCARGVCSQVICGDGVKTALESCELDHVPTSCFDEGFDYGTVKCSAQCVLEASDCRFLGFTASYAPWLLTSYKDAWPVDDATTLVIGFDLISQSGFIGVGANDSWSRSSIDFRPMKIAGDSSGAMWIVGTGGGILTATDPRGLWNQVAPPPGEETSLLLNVHASNGALFVAGSRGVDQNGNATGPYFLAALADGSWTVQLDTGYVTALGGIYPNAIFYLGTNAVYQWKGASPPVFRIATTDAPTRVRTLGGAAHILSGSELVRFDPASDTFVAESLPAEAVAALDIVEDGNGGRLLVATDRVYWKRVDTWRSIDRS